MTVWKSNGMTVLAGYGMTFSRQKLWMDGVGVDATFTWA
jgi:hypothetical protein